MVHAEKWSLKVVLDVSMLKMAFVSRSRAGMNNAAHRWLETATVTSVAKLVTYFGCHASLEKSRNFKILSDSSHVDR